MDSTTRPYIKDRAVVCARYDVIAHYPRNSNFAERDICTGPVRKAISLVAGQSHNRRGVTPVGRPAGNRCCNPIATDPTVLAQAGHECDAAIGEYSEGASPHVKPNGDMYWKLTNEMQLLVPDRDSAHTSAYIDDDNAVASQINVRPVLKLSGASSFPSKRANLGAVRIEEMKSISTIHRHQNPATANDRGIMNYRKVARRVFAATNQDQRRVDQHRGRGVTNGDLRNVRIRPDDGRRGAAPVLIAVCWSARSDHKHAK